MLATASNYHLLNLNNVPHAENRLNAALEYLNAVPQAAQAAQAFSDKGGTIIFTNDGTTYTSPDGLTIHWDPSSGLRLADGVIQSPALMLLHEFGHATLPGAQDDSPVDGPYQRRDESIVIPQLETPVARALGEPVRNGYYGTPSVQSNVIHHEGGSVANGPASGSPHGGPTAGGGSFDLNGDSEDWADVPPAYAADLPDASAGGGAGDDGSDGRLDTPSAWSPGALDDTGAPDPTASTTQNPWIMPQVGILDPDAEAQLSAFQARMNGVQQLLSQIYPMTNGPSTLTGDPTTDLINDPLYHDPSDYDDNGLFYTDPSYGGASSVPPSTVDPYQPGVVTADGQLIPDPAGDPAAPSGFGGEFNPGPPLSITAPNSAGASGAFS